MLSQFSFRQQPGYMLGGQFFNGSLAALVDTNIVKQELIEAGILAEIDGKLIHGPNGYFGPGEYAKKLWEYRKALFFSYIKKPALGLSFLFSCYLLWITYKAHSA